MGEDGRRGEEATLALLFPPYMSLPPPPTTPPPTPPPPIPPTPRLSMTAVKNPVPPTKSMMVLKKMVKNNPKREREREKGDVR